MANFFDQFDPAPSQASSAPPAGNFFDQFDAPAPSRERSPGEAATSRANPFDAGGAATFDERFGSGPMARTPDTSDPLYEGLRAKADEALIGKPGAVNAMAAAVMRGSNALGLNIPRNAGAAAATLIGNGRDYWQNYELAKEQEEALARQYPKTALAGEVGGIVAGAATLPGLGGASTITRRIGQGALTGLGYGAAGELFDSKDVGKAAQAGGIGAVLGGAAVPVVEVAAPIVTKGAKALSAMVSRGLPITSEGGALTATARAMLAREGVAPETLTPEVQAGIGRALTTKGESEGAIREALAAEFGIPLSRGQATGDLAALSLEDAARAGERGTKAQGIADEFGRRQAEAIEAAGTRFADRAGRGVTLEHPQQAAEVVADQAREYARRAGFEADDAQRAADEALSSLRGGFQGDPLDAADAVRQGLRGEATRRKSAYGAAYDEVAQIPGEFIPGALDRIGTTVRSRLAPDVPVDPVLTPYSTRALADLDNLPGLFNAEPGTGPNLRQVEQVRKRLGTYYQGTAQNPTDRRALNAIREEFDRHVSDAVEAGLFGPRQAAQAAPDGFPGAGALEASPARLPAVSGRPERQESLLQFLGRRGGIALDGDARAADYGRIQTGSGPLGRKNGRPIEDFRDELASEGFIRPDDDTGMISRKIGDELHDLIGMERRGEPVYRLADISRGAGTRDVTGRLAGESAAAAERADAFSRQILTELDAVGVRPRDVDPDALRDATDFLSRGRYDDATEAYEAAVLAREPATARGPSFQEVPFDGPTAVPTSDALPSAVPDVVDKMRKARSLFSEYRRTFAPQGAGDDVGQAMRKIVDRDAEPVEVARMLYGGNPGLNMRVADRVKGIVGEGSEAWVAHQQGYLASILNGRDMSPRAVSERIGAALTGERRGLTYRILSGEQAAGLRQAQNALQTAQRTREGVPEWIASLGRTDFDANRVTADLFGSGVPGARPGSAAYAGALKKFVGEDSAEWSGLRLAAWQRLVMKPDGTGMLPPKQAAQRIREFTDGKGAGLARQFFEPELLAEMRRYGGAIQSTVRADGTPRPNGGGAGGKLAGKALDAIATAIGFKVGGFAGAGAAYTARVGSKGIQGNLNARSVRRSFDGMPATAPSGPVLDLAPVGVGAGNVAQYGVQ